MAGFVIPAFTLLTYPIWLMQRPHLDGVELAQWAIHQHGRLVATMLLDVVGVTIWYIFGAATWTYLRDRLPATSPLPACFGVSFVGCVTLLLSGFTAFALFLYRPHSPEVSTLLYDVTFGLLAVSGLPTIVASGSCSIAVYVHRVLPRWAGHLALATAVVHPVLLATLTIRGGPLSLEGFAIAAMPAFLFVWILGTALAMPRSSEQSDS
ncbi:hypothetical protein EF294_00935 [Gordonia oryzae]|uniref:DUF998 domain-containing protein n=1 Tax=Gordonia oryzae TaxID=2487349 RepID=A0A3N4GTM2_9ACTN|nr:hypothetical protein EF294_00935 [Gordonia oryzae]